MTSPRSTRQAITDWLQNQLLGSILDDLRDITHRTRSLEARMGALEDSIRAFRSQVDAETTRIGGVLADLQSQLDQSEDDAAAHVSSDLGPVIDQLRAIGSGSAADPLPAPETPAEPTPGTGI